MARMDGKNEGGKQEGIVSASQYSATRKAAMRAVKGKKVPVGGAPPLDPQKMRGLANGLADAKKAMEGSMFPNLPPPDPDNSSDNPINRAAMNTNKDGKPMTLSEAKRRAAQGDESVDEEVKAKYRPLSKEAKEALKGHYPEAENEEDEPKSSSYDPNEVHPDDEKRLAAEEKLAGELPKMSSLPFDPEEIQAVRGNLYNKERREFIEDRLEPISFGDLVMNGEIEQEIPIRKDFTLTLRTLKEFENLYIVQKLYGVQGSPAYVQELVALYKATCSLIAINGHVLPDHRTKVGNKIEEDVDDKKFEHKVKIVKRFALPVLAEVSIQYDWLVERVNDLLSLDSLKNG